MTEKLNYEISIPILNEENSLEEKILFCVNYINKEFGAGHSINIIIVDNGSTDRSPYIGRNLSKKFDMVDYIRLERRGVGLALKTSWAKSAADIVGYMDLDLATDLRHLREAFDVLLGGGDLVAGSRLSPQARVIGRPLRREITSRVFNRIVKAYFGTSFDDGMCGFKFLRREHLSSLVEMGADSDGWFFATELLICAEYRGLNVVSLPVIWRDDPNSKVRIAKLTVEYLCAMRRLKARL